MRKKIKLILITVLLILSAPNSFARQGEAQPVKLRKISDRLFEVLGGRGAQGGLYIGDNGVLVIDAKMDKKSVDRVIDEITRLTDKPIKYLVNTHSDGDHITGNRYFPETVTFIAHENCRKELFHPKRDSTPSQWNKPELAPFVPSITFREKMDIYLGSKKVQLWYFGVGHTTGDIVVYFPQEKTAFIGDQIFLTRPQLIHSYKGGDSFEHVKTLTRMLQTIDAEKFCSGHSEIASRQQIKNHIDRITNLQQKVKTLTEEKKNLKEIKSEFQENKAALIEAIYNDIKKNLQ